MSSDFAKLFGIPVSRCPISCKLVLGLIVRQLLTKRKYELWTVFSEQPLRFSLLEFALITGLNCDEYPDAYDPEENVVADPRDPVWKEIIGGDAKTTIADISLMLKNEKDMPGERKLQLALLMIVDGVLVASKQVHAPTPKYVNMLSDVEAFLFLGGSESFLKTVTTMRPGKRIPGRFEDPIAHFCRQCQQKTLRLQGFTLSLQLLAFKSIYGMLQKLPNCRDTRTLKVLPFVGESNKTTLTIINVIDVEADPQLSVVAVAQIEAGHPEGWAEWDDEVKDRKVDHLLRLVAEEHVFRESEWPGGDA